MAGRSASQSDEDATISMRGASSVAAKSIRWRSHSWECPSLSGSRTRIDSSRAGAEGIEPAHEIAQHLGLGAMMLYEVPAPFAELVAQAGIVRQAQHGGGECLRVVGRHAEEGAGGFLQPPEHRA